MDMSDDVIFPQVEYTDAQDNSETQPTSRKDKRSLNLTSKWLPVPSKLIVAICFAISLPIPRFYFYSNDNSSILNCYIKVSRYNVLISLDNFPGAIPSVEALLHLGTLATRPCRWTNTNLYLLSTQCQKEKKLYMTITHLSHSYDGRW